MKKFVYLCALFVSINLLIANVYAYVDAQKVQGSKGEDLVISTFINNEPFGKVLRPSTAGTSAFIDSIYLPELEIFAKANNYSLLSHSTGNTLADIRAVRSGDIDILIGMYHATKLYSGIEYIYPAMLNNPIHIVMMPEAISKVKTIEDLKNLRGLRIKDVYFSDYIERTLKNFNLESVEVDKAFEKIFVGDADYIIGGYYSLLIDATKLGVRPYVSFSQDALWDVPVFIGVSKMTKTDRKTLIKLLTAWSNNKTVKDNIKNALKQKIDELQEKYAGTVPPMYIRQSREGEVAPSIERQLEATEKAKKHSSAKSNNSAAVEEQTDVDILQALEGEK